ncbi:MAG: hypothetical protein Q8912_00180 [Bacillota bacterium]|nr:hypothetical protein [Bacillota bacterium]MDP4158552.1 hypothetical protein [Bacillota bacterium]
MRWFWRLLSVLIFLGLLRTVVDPQQRAFIAWQEGQNWSQKIQAEMRQLQKLTQDLPSSIEVEVRRLWRDYQPKGDGKEV